MGNMPENPAILVVSGDADFAYPLAQQVINELKIPCEAIEKLDAQKPWKPSVTLVVSAEEVVNCPVPVLRLSSPPFRMQTILADIVAARQKQLSNDFDIGIRYRVLTKQKELFCATSKKAIALTDKEIKLLQCLTEQNGKVLSREQLLKDVWSVGTELDTHTLDTHVYRLRTKFRELADEDVIIAEDGGYKILGA